MNYASAKEEAEKVVAEIVAAGGKAVALQGDVSDAADVDHLFAAIRQAFGNVDVLVNNAGVYQFGGIEELNEDQYHRQFNINVLGLSLLASEKEKQI